MEREQHHQGMHQNGTRQEGGMKHAHYGRLLLMVILSFIAMYILMYAMVDRLDNVHPNTNQFYMAGLMASPMLVIELVLMGSMYRNRTLNLVLIALGIGIAVVFWILIRQQAAIGDRQFLKSMIPHHAGAILMCEQSSLRDPEILRLCREIVSSQRSEISLMKAKLSASRDVVSD